jgi:hypothetical protein
MNIEEQMAQEEGYKRPPGFTVITKKPQFLKESKRPMTAFSRR